MLEPEEREGQRQTEKEGERGEGGGWGKKFLQTQRAGDRRDLVVKRKQESESRQGSWSRGKFCLQRDHD